MTEMQRALGLSVPDRSAKPRERGISNLVDDGHGIAQLEDILAMCHPYLDIVKLGWASAYLTPLLREKVELLRRHNIRTCLGGMMFEISFWQNKIEEYAAFLEELDIDVVEISNGSLPIPESDKRLMIEYFAKRGFTVLAEVGSKDVSVVSPPEEWIECIQADLACGAWKVITEGRADASAGIYTAEGEIRGQLIEEILESSLAHDDLVFEAPHKRQMAWFIKRVGANVNIGNVPLSEVMNLETLRQGLRGDTVQDFHIHPNIVPLGGPDRESA
jgi:phosphosulfolactate synthase